MCSYYSLGRHPSTTIYLIPAPSEKTTYAKNSTLPRLGPTVSPAVVVVSTRPGAAAAAVAVAPFVPSSLSTASMIFVVAIAESVVVAGILARWMGDETGKASTTSTTDSVVPSVRSTWSRVQQQQRTTIGCRPRTLLRMLPTPSIGRNRWNTKTILLYFSCFLFFILQYYHMILNFCLSNLPSFAPPPSCVVCSLYDN